MEMKDPKNDKLIYWDGFIALFSDLNNMVESSGVVKPNGYAAILCREGYADICIDGKLYHVCKDDLFICHPQILIGKCVVSDDFQFHAIGMSEQYVKQMNVTGGHVWDVKIFLEQNPIISLRPDEATVFCQYYNLLVSKLSGRPVKYHKEVMEALLKAFSYEFREALERLIGTKPPLYTSGQHIFKRFLELLSSSYPKPRAVSDYSSQLCITPKYLSAVCKEASGKTASELINQYVVKDIVFLLQQPDKSIKDIAFELDFPNLSFFGKYVKKHLGVSPKHYRKEMNENGENEKGCLP